MSDWQTVIVALGFVYLMARLRHVNHAAMKFAGLLVLGLAGQHTLPMIAASFARPEVAGLAADRADAVVVLPMPSQWPSDGGTSVATATVSPDILWACDNGFATGTSNSALNDNGCWTLGPTFPGHVESVSAATEGISSFWPSTNALEIRRAGASPDASRMIWADTADIPNAVITSLDDSIQVGHSIYFRWYTRVHMPDSAIDDQVTQDLELHPIQDLHSGAPGAGSCPPTGCNWGTYTIVRQSIGLDVHRSMFNLMGLSSGSYTNTGGTLPNNTTHRHELQIRRVSLTTWSYHARIYQWQGGGEVLLYNDATICKFTTPFDCLSDSTAVTMPQPLHLSTLQAGQNGFFEQEQGYDFDFMYQGAFAICRTTWCGAYTPGEGP